MLFRSPYGRFKCGDGSYVMLGIQNEREWAKFCVTVLGMPELATNGEFNNNTKRTARRAEVVAIIEKVFAGMNASQVVAKLVHHHAPVELREALVDVVGRDTQFHGSTK